MDETVMPDTVDTAPGTVPTTAAGALHTAATSAAVERRIPARWAGTHAATENDGP